MLTKFPIEQIEKHIKYLTDFSTSLPSTDNGLTYNCNPKTKGKWVVTSSDWVNLRGRNYSLVLEQKGDWKVYLDEVFICRLKDFDRHMFATTNRKHGTTSGLGSLFLIVGILMMLGGLFYDPSVSDDSTYSFRRIVNSGKVSEREVITNVGGFLSVCGSIFICAASLKQTD